VNKIDNKSKVAIIILIIMILSCSIFANGVGIKQDSTLTFQLNAQHTQLAAGLPTNTPLVQLSPSNTSIPTATMGIVNGLETYTISSNIEEHSVLAISGNIIVWDAINDNLGNIFGYDLSTKTEFMIPNNGSKRGSPSVSGDVVVWYDYSATLPRIHGYNLRTKEEFIVTSESSPQWEPDISGNNVVFKDWRGSGSCSWGDNGSCTWGIWGVNLETKEEYSFGFDSHQYWYKYSPQISGNNVVWMERLGMEEWAIYFANINSKEKPILITKLADLYTHPRISGEFIIWDAPSKGILVYQISSGRTFQIDYTGSLYYDISNNIAVWIRYGGYIYGYDLSKGNSFLIHIPPDEISNVVIDGDNIAWKVIKNGKATLVGAKLPWDNNTQSKTIIPAPTPTPTPTATPTAIIPAPVILYPNDDILIDTLAPIIRFDLGPLYEPTQGYSYGLTEQGNTGRIEINCNLIFGTPESPSILQCIPKDNLKPSTEYSFHVKYHTKVKDSPEKSISFTTPSSVDIPQPPVIIFPVEDSVIAQSNYCFQYSAVQGAIIYEILLQKWSESTSEWKDNGTDWIPWASDYCVSRSLDKGNRYLFKLRVLTQTAWSDWMEVNFSIMP
jgi:beta propeller repeat protein